MHAIPRPQKEECSEQSRRKRASKQSILNLVVRFTWRRKLRSIKKMLNEQDLVVGLMAQHVCQPWLAKVYADAGSDFLYIENEHMFFNQADLAGLILSSRSRGMPVVAKCEYVSRGSICKLLDAGVTGIQPLPGADGVSRVTLLSGRPRLLREVSEGRGSSPSSTFRSSSSSDRSLCLTDFASFFAAFLAALTRASASS